MAPLSRVPSSVDLMDSGHSIDVSETSTTAVIPLVDLDVKKEPLSSALSSSSDKKTTRKEPKNVHFGSVNVREYDRIIGDHPDVTVGPPLAIGWDYNEIEVFQNLDLDRFEELRQDKRRINLRLSSITRRNMMIHVFGFSEEEVNAVEKEVAKKTQPKKKAVPKARPMRAKAGAAMRMGMRSLRRTFSFENLMAVPSHG